MRISLPVVWLLLLVLAVPAASEDESPQTAAAAAQALLEAHRAFDDVTFARLASRQQPDAWLVAHELLAASPFIARAFSVAREQAGLDWEETVGQAEGANGRTLYQYVYRHPNRRLTDPARAHLHKAQQLMDDGDAAAARSAIEKTRSKDPVMQARIARLRARVFRALDLHSDAASAARNAAMVAARVGWLRWALLCWEESAAAARAVGDVRAESKALLEAGTLHLRLDRTRGTRLGGGTHEGIDRAVPMFERAVSILETAGNRVEAAKFLQAAYRARRNAWAVDGEALWDQPAAIGWLLRAREIWHTLGEPANELDVVNLLAASHEEVGDIASAVSWHKVALGLCARAGRDVDIPPAVASYETFQSLLGAYESLGDRFNVLRTLKQWEQALATIDPDGALKDLSELRYGVGGALTDAYAEVGDLERAIENERRLFAVKQGANLPPDTNMLLRLGKLHRDQGQVHRALSVLRNARDASPMNIEAAFALAQTHEMLGEHEEAALAYQSWLATHAGSEESWGRVRAEIGLAKAHTCLGRFEHAIALLVPHRTSKTPPTLRIEALVALAGVRTATGDHVNAVTLAREALWTAERTDLATGYEDDGKSTHLGRAKAEAVRVGATAAARLGDPKRAWYFLERGRAQRLGWWLQRTADTDARVSLSRLEVVESQVRAKQAIARARLAALGRDATRKKLRAARDEVAGLDARLRYVTGAIQAMFVAPIARGNTVPFDEIQTHLADDEVFVSYGFLAPNVLAVVITPQQIRILTLGSPKEIETACARALESLADPTSDPTRSREVLRRALIGPLLLEPSARRLFVSADGPLQGVPFSFLLEDRTAQYVPSGTVLRHLAKRRTTAGQGVLALGNPDYTTLVSTEPAAVYRPASRGSLAPLPGSAIEARSVGTKVLLGAQASETALRDTLARNHRWRSVHLACHGVLDDKRPVFSSLALSPTQVDDGFLSVLDVTSMRVDADLVVLSACETARGAIEPGEGVIGLPRAFLLAGASTVVCSFWRVDDEATQALMAKFYERWRGDVGAAQALREAQAHIRSQDKWKHPYFWAAWALYGLPN